MSASSSAAAAAAASQASVPSAPKGDMGEPQPPKLDMELEMGGGVLAGADEPDEKVYYEKFKMPDAVMDLFHKMDKEGTGYVGKKDLDRAMAAAKRGGGGLDAKTLAEFDADGDGIVDSTELAMAQAQHGELKKHHARMGRLVAGLVIALLLLSLAMFGISFAAAYMAKDMHVDDGGVVKANNGDIARMGAAEMSVVDGVLFPRALDATEDTCNNATGLCPASSSKAHAMATRPAEESRGLTSRIADSVFQNLDKLNFQLSDASGSFNVTFRVHGFMRVPKTPSQCGTLVYIDVLNGAVILDDTTMYFDEKLAEHFKARGLDVDSMTTSTPIGRRLSSNLALIQGIFSLFDDVDFGCEASETGSPQSPSLPYQMLVLEKRPCFTEDYCKSKIFEGQMLPGYDAESDSIITIMQVIVTEDTTVNVQRYPNHPSQELITVLDHTTKTATKYQVNEDTDVLKCYAGEYKPEVSFNASGLTATYLGEETRPTTTYKVMGENVTFPSATHRMFRLELGGTSDVVSGAIDMDMDVSTFMPSRIKVGSARRDNLTLEESHMTLQELTSTEASNLIDAYTSALTCSNVQGVPKITTAFRESMLAVSYYVKDLPKKDNAGWTESDDYWSNALVTVNQTFKDEYYASTNATARRLTQLSGGLNIPLDVDGTGIHLQWNLNNGFCFTAEGTDGGGSNSPWSVTGKISAGDTCSGFSGWGILGSLTVKYTVGKKFSIMGYEFGCEGSIEGTIGAGQGCYPWTGGDCTSDTYSCGRRLGDSEDRLPWLPTAEADEVETEVAVPAAFQVNETMKQQLQQFEDFDDDEEGEIPSRRLIWGRRRRAPDRRRRDPVCNDDGTEIDAAIAISASCDLLVLDASAKGTIDLDIGPFPDYPLSAEVEVNLNLEGCVDLGWLGEYCANIGETIYETEI